MEAVEVDAAEVVASAAVAEVVDTEVESPEVEDAAASRRWSERRSRWRQSTVHTARARREHRRWQQTKRRRYRKSTGRRRWSRRRRKSSRRNRRRRRAGRYRKSTRWHRRTRRYRKSTGYRQSAWNRRSVPERRQPTRLLAERAQRLVSRILERPLGGLGPRRGGVGSDDSGAPAHFITTPATTITPTRTAILRPPPNTRQSTIPSRLLQRRPCPNLIRRQRPAQFRRAIRSQCLLRRGLCPRPVLTRCGTLQDSERRRAPRVSRSLSVRVAPIQRRRRDTLCGPLGWSRLGLDHNERPLSECRRLHPTASSARGLRSTEPRLTGRTLRARL